MSDTGHLIPCRECGVEIPDFLANHLLEAHGLSTAEYLSKYPGALTVSSRLLKRFQASHPNIHRAHPPAPTELTITVANIDFSVNPLVPASACLPMPEHYRVPQYGELGDDICLLVVALRMERSSFIWGMPGTGKDAFFHYWSWVTRTPAMIRQIKPGTDIESWYFSRGFTEKGTFWEEGAVTKALRDGYEVPDPVTGKMIRIPYLVLLTDFDRADPDQAEQLRLVTDSISKRIDGPAGLVYDVLPGTIIAATANTSGSGDERGRAISARPIDSTILERFDIGLMFHAMDWRDEEPIIRSKFPILAQRCPSAFNKLGATTKLLRDAIAKDELHCEFSHRGLCSVARMAQDMLLCNPSKQAPKNLLALAARVWLDRLPDRDNREKARKIMDGHLGTLDEGGAAQSPSGNLLDQVGGKKGSR